MSKKPFNTFDLPSYHLTNQSADYVPPRTRDSIEAERRHELPTGTVLLEQQQRGITIAKSVLEIVSRPADVDYARQMLAAAGINTSWYGFARGADVMRRRLKLPQLFYDTDDEPFSIATIDELADKNLTTATEQAAVLVASKTNRRPTDSYQTLLGRSIGNVSLQLASLRIPVAAIPANPILAQRIARQSATAALRDARELSSHTGTHPSLAQLADADSPLSVHWRRTAPDQAYAALEAAAEF